MKIICTLNSKSNILDEWGGGQEKGFLAVLRAPFFESIKTHIERKKVS